MGRKSAGAYLRTLREEKSLSQKYIANHLSVSDKQILRWEKGLADPAASMLIAFTSLVDGDMNDISELMLSVSDSEKEGIERAKIRAAKNRTGFTLHERNQRVEEYVFQIIEIALRLRTDSNRLSQYAEMGKELLEQE
jgi:transcriptional regulator with XRE-family HTH domain